MSLVDEALKEIKERDRKANKYSGVILSGGQSPKSNSNEVRAPFRRDLIGQSGAFTRLPGNPNAPAQITNLPYYGSRYPSYTNYVNAANKYTTIASTSSDTTRPPTKEEMQAAYADMQNKLSGRYTEQHLSDAAEYITNAARTSKNIQDTFSTDAQFANTLYPETIPRYYNGSKPQKNYYTKEKSIYGENTDEALDEISNILTAASLVPGIDTFADAAAIPVDLLRGDYISAGLDAFGILPFVGEVADTAKLAKAGINIADATRDTNKLHITHRLTKSSKEKAKLLNDIKNNGIKETIKYVEHNGIKYVVDGHHRLHIARILGLQNIPVEKVNLPYKGYNSIEDLFWE